MFRLGSFSNAQDFGGEGETDGRDSARAPLRSEVEDRISSTAEELFRTSLGFCGVFIFLCDLRSAHHME